MVLGSRISAFCTTEVLPHSMPLAGSLTLARCCAVEYTLGQIAESGEGTSMLSRIVAVALMGMALGACASSGNPFASAPLPSTTLANEPPPAMPSGPMPGETPIDRAPAPPSPAVANAAIGGMFGAAGAGLDDDDKQRAYAAQVQALESGGPGAPVGWKNPDSGHYGSIVPGPAFDRGGAKCRQYTHTIYIDSKPATARGAACRSANGRWTPAG